MAMNSSISGSEMGADPASLAAGQWLRAFAQTTVAGAVVIAAFVVLTDPYDSGRFNAFGMSGVVETRTEYLAVSRGRNLEYDAAIIGNSHTELIDAVRLSQLSRRHFTQLSVPGALVVEQATLARWFIDQHAGRAITMLVGVDEFWCMPPPLHEGRPFPSWLYGDTWSYLANVIGPDGLTHAGRRIGVALGLVPRLPPNAYSDSWAGYVWQLGAVINGHVDPRLHMEEDVGQPVVGADVMDSLVARAGPRMHMILLWTPVYAAALPVAGSPTEARWNECKRSYRELAEKHQNVVLMDWRVGGPIADVPENFWDRTHYRSNIARKLEEAIADAMTR